MGVRCKIEVLESLKQADKEERDLVIGKLQAELVRTNATIQKTRTDLLTKAYPRAGEERDEDEGIRQIVFLVPFIKPSLR